MNYFNWLFKNNNPVYVTKKCSSTEIWTTLTNYKLTAPMGLLDMDYYYTDMVGWGNIMYDMIFSSTLYKTDKFDCDNYALKAMTICAEKYGLNTFGFAIGLMPLGMHAFNIFYVGEKKLMLFEPNAGFANAGIFEMGQNGYKPQTVLL